MPLTCHSAGWLQCAPPCFNVEQIYYCQGALQKRNGFQCEEFGNHIVIMLLIFRSLLVPRMDLPRCTWPPSEGTSKLSVSLLRNATLMQPWRTMSLLLSLHPSRFAHKGYVVWENGSVLGKKIESSRDRELSSKTPTAAGQRSSAVPSQESQKDFLLKMEILFPARRKKDGKKYDHPRVGSSGHGGRSVREGCCRFPSLCDSVPH
jgi:hypothetical protein